MTEYQLPYRANDRELVTQPHINPVSNEDDTTLLALTLRPSERLSAMDSVQDLEVQVSVDQARGVAEAFRGAWAEIVDSPTSDGKVVLRGQAAHEINQRGILQSLPDGASDSPDSTKDGQSTNPEVKTVMEALPKTLSSNAAPVLLSPKPTPDTDTPPLDVLGLGTKMPPGVYLTERVVQGLANTQPARVIVGRHQKDTQAIATLFRRVHSGLKRLVGIKAV